MGWELGRSAAAATAAAACPLPISSESEWRVRRPPHFGHGTAPGFGVLYASSSSWLSGVPPAIRPGSASGRALESGRGWVDAEGLERRVEPWRRLAGWGRGTCGCLAPLQGAQVHHGSTRGAADYARVRRGLPPILLPDLFVVSGS